MRAELVIHPDVSCPAVDGIAVDVMRVGASRVGLAYRVSGDVGRLRIPAGAAPERTDGLWKHTCFELFLRTTAGGYVEFNFSPSGQWAAYRFSGYREGMAELEIAAPRISWSANARGGELRVELDIPGAKLDGARMAVTAVIEVVGGEKSYWSLAHPPGRPDFHHPVNFAADVPLQFPGCA